MYRVCRIALLVLLLPGFGAASDSRHPLEPPDRGSPRGTLDTFLSSVDAAWSLYEKGDEGFRKPWGVAMDCLDTREIPPRVRNHVAAETTLLLKEVLDRIELPAASEIPGPEEVAEEPFASWTIPHTEITLSRIEEGPQAGKYLFDSATFGRIRDDYEKVEHLPFRPGKQGARLEKLRHATEGILFGRLVYSFPAWAKTEIGGQLLWQWSAVLFWLALGVLAVWLAFRLGRRWSRSSDQGESGWWSAFLVPIALIVVTLLLRRILTQLIPLAGPPYFHAILVLTAIGYLGGGWFIALVINRIGRVVVHLSQSAERALNRQLIRVFFRALNILVVTLYLFSAGQTLGLPVPALVAGLGVGGLAIALAAQSTIENFIAGIILYSDQPVRVGDLFRSGDRMGVVEEIGLRSTKIRTLGRTLLTIPNAQFAKLELENITLRDRILLRETLRLRLETTPDQLRWVLGRLHQMLLDHPLVDDETARVRLVGVGEYALEVELYCHVRSSVFPEFLAIREEIFLQAITIVEDAGTRLAVPVQIELQGHDREFDEDRARAAEQEARRWRQATERTDRESP